jgi:undecaprenyl-diphosphatase
LLASGETFFQSHGAKSVFIGRFVPTVRAIIPMVAGIVGMPPIRFYIANVLSALLWGPAHILPGAAIGLSFGALGIPANRMAEVWIGVAIVLVLGGWLANRFWRRARA